MTTAATFERLARQAEQSGDPHSARIYRQQAEQAKRQGQAQRFGRSGESIRSQRDLRWQSDSAAEAKNAHAARLEALLHLYLKVESEEDLARAKEGAHRVLAMSDAEALALADNR